MSELPRPTSFALAALSVVDIGPLRSLKTISFQAGEAGPSNLYLLMGMNGSGKTTVLDAVFTAMHLLGAAEHEQYGLEDVDQGSGGFQLDAFIELDDGRRAEKYLISIVGGAPGLLRNWKPEELPPGVTQIVLIYARRSADGRVERSVRSDPAAIQFADAVLEHLGEPPTSLFDQLYGYPTLLYFRSDRSIVRTEAGGRGITRPRGLDYHPAHLFGADTGDWEESLDNLFVWFAWLDADREREARRLVNELVFKHARKRLGEVDRQHLSVPVEVEEGTHRLDQLSSGERQLVQLVVRIAAQMTGPTIVLIDEIEQHLHITMRRRLMSILKEWAKTHQKLSFILTSHHFDAVRILQPKLEENGLRKSGALFKTRHKAAE
jgi:ABC-type branched-subunit amino acid transport system ATPase component